MINPSHKLFLTAIFLLLSSLSYAGASDNSVNKLVLLSGLSKQVGQFPALVKSGFMQASQQSSSMPADELKAIVSSVDKSFVPKKMLDDVKASIKASITEKQAKELLTWYESDLGKKITQAEEQASTPKAYQEMMTSAQSLLADKERVAIAKNLDKLLSASEMTMEMQKNTSLAMYSVMMNAASPGKPVDVDALKPMIDAQIAQSKSAVEQMVQVSFVYSYKNIAIKDLKKYEAFLARKAARKFNEAAFKGISKSLDASAINWAEKLGEIIKDKK